MLRIFIPILFMAFFASWVLYRLLIKRDLKKNMDTLLPGLFFTGIWLLIFYYFLN